MPHLLQSLCIKSFSDLGTNVSTFSVPSNVEYSSRLPTVSLISLGMMEAAISVCGCVCVYFMHKKYFLIKRLLYWYVFQWCFSSLDIWLYSLRIYLQWDKLGNNGHFGCHFGFREGLKWFYCYLCVSKFVNNYLVEFLMLKNIYLDI